MISDDSSVILEVKGLKKVFKGDLLKKSTTAISDVNCRFIEGTINLVFGHNGAGKTTTIKVILGLLKPTAGKVLYRDKPLTIRDKNDFGYMPEVHRLSPLLSVVETLNNHIRYYQRGVFGRSVVQVMDEHLKKLGLWGHRKKKVKELSKGLQRRLAFALAVIHDPQVIILDEPFSGLDIGGKKLMEKLLLEQKEKNKTLIMSSHDIFSSVRICDHFHFIKDGKTAYSSLDDCEVDEA
ncbi:MAG: ABC transporter ATP-binding protein, partial [Proteobacteria bacterium]|nr:ABC transporter ATP-binding protein [Pseudomonadota bacterium]